MSTAIDEVLVEVGRESLRAAALIAGELIELVIEPRQRSGAVGSLYLGRVVRYVPALRAAFVEIGLARPAMLDSERPVGEGDVLAVQVIEAEAGDKAARVSRRIALEGRYAVLLPGAKGASLSRRVAAAPARKRLQASATALKRPGEGLILRAAAEDAAEPALAADVAALRVQWAEIQGRQKAAMPPACLVDTGDGLARLLRRYAGVRLPRYVFSDALIARRATQLGAQLFGDAPAVETEAMPGALFERHGIADMLAAAAEKIVRLPCGGRIIVETTAALTAIDVDTAAASDRDDAILTTNLEAAAEIGRQLRLRDIGGLIVADFGRMAARSARARVEAALARAVTHDRVPVQLVGWTKAGMFEIIRPRVRAAGSIE